ncbi:MULTISPECIES: carboxylating nicotinate-nucleotide diphosphorylase [unclassified Brevundimonas]|uniref:carboxylating nicotinate-nucleotide diphosphorylase n=1 Tax=unclassified Brevundimonas TaxID=2622653 RepID=UPI0025BEEBCD|nr:MULTISPECIES: carboxylating nicotinate-nucleotide diphosphorylase [unclassified Brevundimonas]
MRELPDMVIEPVVRMALAEDLGRCGDVTAQACIPVEARMTAQFRARQEGVMAGGAAVRIACLMMDPSARVDVRVMDGQPIAKGDVLVEVEGSARGLLAAERTALNILGRLCGIATQTRAYVQAVAGTHARIADTRKTTPGLRALEKHAVACGGGINHRFGLDDAILIKDNHVAVCGGVGKAVRAAKAFAPHLMKVEVEVDSLDQLGEALAEGPDVIMLDNFALTDMEEAVRRVKASGVAVVLEASGGVNLDTVAAIAATGVDVISVGALTHSVIQLDIGLDAV